MILITLLVAFAQICFKFGVEGKYYFFILGFVLYGLGFLLLILKFRKNDLSKTYPALGLVYVWVLFFSFLFLGETLTVFKITGISAIVTGVFLLK